MRIVNCILLLSLTFGTSLSFAQTSGEPRITIVGGEEATRGEFPFIVSLRGFFGGHTCGASLVKKNWVLTAAHCVSGIKPRSVALGLHERKRGWQTERISIKRVIVHPEYAARGPGYDIALLELKEDSTFEPVAINTNEIEILEGEPEIMATTAGWGATNENAFGLPDLLQKVNVPLISHEQCNLSYDNSIDESMLCAGYPAGGKDSCQGDSGGPLVVKGENDQYLLVGVVSWGKGCARAGYPGVYAKVSAVSTWIEQTAR